VIGALVATTCGAFVFSMVAWRARDVLSLMKRISALSRPTPSPDYDSKLAFWYVRLFGLAGAALGFAMAVTTLVELVRR